ncbi:MAG: hypothetical protein KC550_05090, partial [Nanoarchaeota archaeon]|nr:hypothetical protein [Nanoarchaeota archaeon]
MGEDLSKFFDKYNLAIQESLETTALNKKYQEMFSIPFKYQEEGKEIVAQMMGLNYNSFNQHLNSNAEKSPTVVGFYDGYLKTYLGIDTNRMPNSKEYQHGIKFGEMFGNQSAFMLFASKEELEETLNPNKLIQKG